MIEEWRMSYNGYQVSNLGRVKSPSGTLLKPNRNAKGYEAVRMHGSKARTALHRAVCEAFYGPQPPGKPLVRHLNGNPSDNRSINLRWGTYSENALDRRLHGTAIGPRGSSNRSVKLTEDQVISIKNALSSPYRGLVTELAREFDVTTTIIKSIKAGKIWGWLKVEGFQEGVDPTKGKPKLTEDQVRQIKKRLEPYTHGLYVSLAQEYAVSDGMISKIHKGLAWKEVV
jgi:hypothetical protein